MAFLYMLVCILWGVFAIRIQSKLEYPKRWYNDWFIVFLLNTIACPIAMIVAIIRCPVDKRNNQ